MKNLIAFITMIALVAFACNQSTEKEKMAITTNSEKAKKLYDDAIAASEDVYLAKFRNLANESLKEDPDFFMANFQLATYYLYFGNEKRFNEYAASGVNCKAKLSKGELLLKDALKRLVEDKNADVTDIGKKLIQEFPKDVYAYYVLSMFQALIKDYDGQVKTLKSAIEFAEKPAPLYNMLGYAYMALQQYDLAEQALDKYIELAPNIPNPYDSKGDFYMQTKDYGKAYESFMKAHEIDTLWGYRKAINVKAIIDSLAKE